MKKGLDILNAQAQCSWGWLGRNRCQVRGIENLVWVGNQLFCTKHAKEVQQTKRREGMSKRETVVCISCNQGTTFTTLDQPCAYCGGKVVSLRDWQKMKGIKEEQGR